MIILVRRHNEEETDKLIKFRNSLREEIVESRKKNLDDLDDKLSKINFENIFYSDDCDGVMEVKLLRALLTTYLDESKIEEFINKKFQKPYFWSDFKKVGGDRFLILSVTTLYFRSKFEFQL